MAKLSVELQRYFLEEERQPQVRLADILSLAGERVFGFLFVLISIPSALPIPAAGYSIPFAIIIFVLAVQLIAGAKRPWLPQRMMNSSLPLVKVRSFVKSAIPWLRRIEALARPRLTYVCASLPGRILLGVAIALMSVSMMIPIPLTNTLPAIGIFVTAFGLTEDDGFICLAGLAICVLGATVTTSVLVLGAAAVYQGIDFLKEWLQTLLS
ncbi:MAG: exopolysaccharide biosynthesis protein [Cyanophyceae cyanobacterium]